MFLGKCKVYEQASEEVAPLRRRAFLPRNQGRHGTACSRRVECFSPVTDSTVWYTLLDRRLTYLAIANTEKKNEEYCAEQTEETTSQTANANQYTQVRSLESSSIRTQSTKRYSKNIDLRDQINCCLLEK